VASRPRSRDVLRGALAAYHNQFRRVAGTAIVLYVPIGFLEAFFVDAGEGYYERHRTFLTGLLFAAVVVVTTIGFAGDAFFSGYLEAAVGEEFHGHPHRSFGEIVRVLPYRRLIVASILLGLVTAVGSLAFLLPGLALFTLFCLVGPLINIEGLTVRGSFRRSYHLVRPVFLLAAVLVTLPVAVEHEIVHGLQIWAEDSYALKALVDGFSAAVIFSIVGMIEVTLAYLLIERDRASVPRDEPDDGHRSGGT
jgi:hypothetical protein